MPKPRPTKRQKKESDDESSTSSSSSSTDSGPDDRYPPPKQEKTSSVSRKTAASKVAPKDTDSKSEPMKNDNGDFFWELDRNRRITVRSFKGKTLIDIREYYEKDGKHLPGKKGVSLSAMEWNKLKDFAGDVDKVIQKM